jgi:hypothetical protein
MGHREEEIKKLIRNEVFDGCFKIGNFQKGRNILYKLYLKYYYILSDMETKRMILYNLVFSERMLKNEKAVAEFVQQLKKDMDNTLNYKKDNPNNYCNMLSYYCDCTEIVLNDVEKIEHYKFSYQYYQESYSIDRTLDTYIRMMNIKFNISKLEKNFLKVLEIIKDIHNIKNDKAVSTLEQMLWDVENIDKELYKEALRITEITSKQCV